jgi:epoxyqueuosine reductase
MNWMTRDPGQRTDPRKLFSETRSVVVVALNYYTPHQHSDNPGKVSRYAWGDDYHEVLADKLRELLSWTKTNWPEAEGKVCVDIQPTMDKAWAARAGLGWMGKHTNLITEEYGSWVFIGELLLNLELEYADEEVADQCGSCTLCIDACPTSAIVEPYVVDSNLCISHATIESRAPELSAKVAAHLDGWLYGCDICQDVCPWNQMTPATEESRFEPRQGNINASPAEVLDLTPEAYAARFRHSAMKRAKLSGLKRNARSLLSR